MHFSPFILTFVLAVTALTVHNNQTDPCATYQLSLSNLEAQRNADREDYYKTGDLKYLRAVEEENAKIVAATEGRVGVGRVTRTTVYVQS